MCVKALVFFYHTSQFYQLIHVSVICTATASSANLRISRKAISFLVSSNPNTDGSYSPIYSYHMKNTNYYRHLRSDSVKGLILVYGFRIWNPSLRRVSTLPHPKEHSPTSLDRRKFFLGYDPLEGKHKVLCSIYGSNYVKPLILTLGGQESWRIITKGSCPIHRPSTGGYGPCFNGILYYEALDTDGRRIIMSFDVKSESFSPIKYPECSHFRWSNNLITYEGSLALLTTNFPDGSGELYILKDAHGHEWMRQCLPHVPFKSEWRNLMQFKGITDAGELGFAPKSFVKSFYILYFDPRRNSIREAFFEGFMGDEFRRSHGDSNDRTYSMSVYANHMESLVSL